MLLMEHETCKDMAASLPRCIDEVYNSRRLHSTRLPQPHQARRGDAQIRSLTLPTRRGLVQIGGPELHAV
jgi:hypothetical protein